MNISKSAAWNSLQLHNKEIASLSMRQLFADDPARSERFSLQAAGIMLDYSKNRITDATRTLLMDLARTAEVEEKRERMFG